jgi:hypothetical protein
VFDNFLAGNIVEELLKAFPVDQRPSDKLYEDALAGLHKRQISPEVCDPWTRSFFHFLNSEPFLIFLEQLTGIEGLIGDPFFEGGGFHEISSGGKLSIHADFRINENLHLNRRINVLLYLNKDWKVEYNGFLELWDKKIENRVQSIAPEFNRCVIFNTDADSYHGHPESLETPSEVTRKSIALYYYTASKKVYEEIPANSTMYVARPFDSAGLKRRALKSRLQNHAKDWLPPVCFRAIQKLRQRRGISS